MISKKDLFFKLTVASFFFCFLVGCAKEIAKIKDKIETDRGSGYIELNCPNYYFYGDVLVNNRNNYLEVFIYNFGNEILKIEGLDDKIKVFYFGSEIKDDYYKLFPLDIRFLMAILRKYFFQQTLEEDNNLFIENDNERRVLNIFINNCNVRLFLTRDI